MSKHYGYQRISVSYFVFLINVGDNISRSGKVFNLMKITFVR